jgi:hypothetical protein
MTANASAILATPRIVEVQDSITRPGNTTAYTAGDAMSDNATEPTAEGYFEFDLPCRKGGGVTLIDFTLHKSAQGQTAAKFALLLFTTLPALAGFEDNAAVAITDVEMKECKGVVVFNADEWANVATGDVQTQAKCIGIVSAAASVKVYGILVAQDAYTPGNAEVYTLTAHAIQD